jgi:hypothetical protein
MILKPETLTRINDKFILDESISCSVPETRITHPLIQGSPNSNNSRFQASFYDQIAMDIVTETVFHYPYPYISEKTLRPIACKRMFIVLGAADTLKLLHSKGFLTFPDFIDESYDSIQYPIQRFHQTVRSIRHFLDRPLKEIQAFYEQNQQRFQQNFDLLKNLRQKECEELNRYLNQSTLKSHNI